MENAADSMLSSLTCLADSLIENIEYDINADRSIFYRPMLKKHLSLFCRPHPYIIGTAPEIKLAAQVYEYFPQATYNKEFKRRFLNAFICRNSQAKNAVELIAKKLGNSEYSKLFAELYLLPFCDLLIEEHLKTGSLGKEQLESLIARFIQDLNQGLKIVLQIGLDGLMVANDVLLKPNEVEEILVRKPKLEDMSEPILVVEHWDGDYDNKGNLSIPNISSVIELKLNKIEWVPASGSIADPGICFYDKNVDWLVNSSLQKAMELFNLIVLFQSKALPHFQSMTFSLILENLAKEGGRYDVDVPTKSSDIINNKEFVLTAENQENLKRFSERLLRANMQKRIHGKFENENSYTQQVVNPTEIAFNRYREILGSQKDEKVRIHETIEALEGFFAPEKHTKKEFISKVVNLTKMLSVNHNDTEKILLQGYRMRSIYTHQGHGCNEEQHIRSPKTMLEQMKIIRQSIERERQANIAKLTLNYLRISIVARILSGIPDVTFVKLLSTEEGREQLKSLLKDPEHFTHGDPLELSDTVEEEICPECGRLVPAFAMDIHKEGECPAFKTAR